MYYKKIVVLVLLSLLANTNNSFAQQHKPERISNVATGEFWLGLTPSEKKVYIKGIEDGTVNVVTYYVSSEQDKIDAYSMLPEMLNVISIDGFIHQIDLFYANNDNLKIPVIYSLVVVRNRLAGVEEKDILNYIDYLRDMGK